MLAPWKKIYEQPRQCIKKQRHLPGRSLLGVLASSSLALTRHGTGQRVGEAAIGAPAWVFWTRDFKKKKNRDITFPMKVHLVKAVVFPVIMYGYENWTIKKAEP